MDHNHQRPLPQGDVVDFDAVVIGVSMLDSIKLDWRDAVAWADDYVKRMQGDREKDPYERLSTREREVLPMLADGRTNHDVADRLHISPNTVQTYRQRIMRKLDLHSKTEILKYALRKRLISLDP